MGDRCGGDDEASAGSDGSQVAIPVYRGDGLMASFEVRYVGGAAGERIAAGQASALAALSKWQADCSEVGRS